MYLTELLDAAAGRRPLKPALIDGDETVTYAGLLEEIAVCTLRLTESGVRRGTRVGLCLPNSIAYVALTFACWRAGAIVIPIPVECADQEVSAIATTLRLDAMLGSKPRGQSDGVEMPRDVFLSRLSPTQPADNHGLNIAFIRFTSGTTSARKGVVLTHETIRDRVVAANKALQIGPEDTVIWRLPMSHHFLVTIVLYLSQGATIVLARQVLAGPFLESINRWRGTVLYAAPFHYGLLARDASEVGIPSVRLAVSTTCGLSQAVAEQFHQRFGRPLVQALGIIELGLVCANVDDPAARWNSVGRPLPDFAVDVLNPDADGVGEIRFAGPGFFDAYAEPWTPREQAMPDGWFSTGDIGRVDADGYVYLVSRKTAVINLAGRKVFPEEIEAILNRHPAVRESRVYGAAHPHLGEVIEAEVALRSVVDSNDRIGPIGPISPLDPGALRDFCRAHIGPDKIPSRIHIVPNVARTAVTGKVRRSAPLPVV